MSQTDHFFYVNAFDIHILTPHRNSNFLLKAGYETRRNEAEWALRLRICATDKWLGGV